MDGRSPALVTSGSARAVGLLWLAYAGLLALLSFGYNSATWINLWPWWGVLRIATALPIILTIVLGLWFGRPTDGYLSRSWGLWLLLGLGTVQLASAAVSSHAAESMGTAIVVVSDCCLAAALALSLRGGIFSDRNAMRAFGAFGLVFSVVSLAQWVWMEAAPMIRQVEELNSVLGGDVFKLNPDGFRNPAPFGHSNYTAGAALLFLPWLVGLALTNRGRWRVTWWAVSILTFVVLISTGSRGAVIGLATGAGFALMLVSQALQWSFKRMISTGSLAVVLLLIVIAAVPRVRNSVVNSFSGKEMTVGDEQRVAMLEIGLHMGSERWVLGQGPGLVPRLYPRYRDQVEGGTDIALQLHSTPVQIWAETGSIGLLCAAVLAGFAVISGFQVVRESRHSVATQWMVAASGVSLVAYLGFALTDFQIDVPLIAAATFADIGILFGVRLRPTGGGFKQSSAREWAVVAVGGAALLLLVVLTVPEWRARRVFANGVESLEKGIGGADEFNAAVIAASELQPDNPHYLAGGAAAHLTLASSSADPQERVQHLGYARALLEQVVRIEPYNEFAQFNLGWLLLESDPGKAAGYFRFSATLLPDRGGCYFGLGLALLESGDEHGAVNSFALEIINDPAFVTAPAWDTPALAPYRDDSIHRASEICHEYGAHSARPLARRVEHIRLLLDWLEGDENASALAEVSPASASGMFETSSSGSGGHWDDQLAEEIPGWLIIRAAGEKPNERRNIFKRFILMRTRRTATEVELDLLETMVEKYGTDWRSWVWSSESRAAPFVKTYRRDRHSYPILFRNMDIPVALDAYLIQESTLIEIFFRDVFPRRGYAPDVLLLERVRDDGVFSRAE